MCICTHAYVCVICMHVCVYAHVHVHVDLHVYECMRMNVCMYIYYICTCMYYIHVCIMYVRTDAITKKLIVG